MTAEVQKQALKDINSELLPSLNMYGFYSGAGTAGPTNPYCGLGSECATTLPTGFPGMFQNIFNYSSPEYQVGMTLSINLRNRQAKADQFRAVLAYRQSQISPSSSKRTSSSTSATRSLLLNRPRPASTPRRRRATWRSAPSTSPNRSSSSARNPVPMRWNAERTGPGRIALDTAQTLFEKAKVDIDRAIGETLERTGVSIDDAKSGVVTHAP